MWSWVYSIDNDVFGYYKEKKEEIWLSPLTKALTLIENFKRHSENTKPPTTFATADRLMTASWSKDRYPTGVVQPV